MISRGGFGCCDVERQWVLGGSGESVMVAGSWAEMWNGSGVTWNGRRKGGMLTLHLQGAPHKSVVFQGLTRSFSLSFY